MPLLASVAPDAANKTNLPTVTPQPSSFGAEIGQIDLRQPLSDSVFERVHGAFLAHKVLVFRGQPLDDEAHQAFAMRFGPLEGHINVSTRHAKLPSLRSPPSCALPPSRRKAATPSSPT